MKKNTANVPKLRFPGFTDDWEQRKLGEIATFAKGSGFSKNDLRDEGTPIILYGRLYTKYQAIISEVDTYAEPRGNVLYSTGNEVIIPASGETADDIAIASAVVAPGIMLGGDLNIVYPTDNIDATFVAISISNGEPQKELAKKAQGKSVVHLHNSDLKEVTLAYPRNDEQKKISCYFTKIDHLITLHQRKLAHLQAKKKGLLQKMFPQQGECFPELRFPGFTDAWEQRKLGDFGKATGGTSIESEFTEGGKYKVISIGSYSEMSNYMDQGIRVDKTNKTESRILNKDDLTMILNDKTASGNIIGRVLLIDADNTYIYNQRTERIEVNKNEYEPRFLYQLLNADNIRSKIIRASQGNTQIYVNWSAISELRYAVPLSKSEQKQIGAFFHNFDNLITLHQRKLTHLQKQKKALLQQMFV